MVIVHCAHSGLQGKLNQGVPQKVYTGDVHQPRDLVSAFVLVTSSMPPRNAAVVVTFRLSCHNCFPFAMVLI